ncbi:deoxyribodipyrimidine photo-lyase [bacterium]|nr:deoxyribodipyrimidine photo-lyase [bacterium]
MSLPPTIVWFRDDLRLHDNPALDAAAHSGAPLVLLYILDDQTDGVRPLGGAARWWLDKSLRSLGGAVADLGGTLTLRRGPSAEVLADLVTEVGADRIVWNRRYSGARLVDQSIKTDMQAKGVRCDSFHAATLIEPFAMSPAPGGGYKVYFPFWRALKAQAVDPGPLPPPDRLFSAAARSDVLKGWGLHPSAPDWSAGLHQSWTPGEPAARERLSAFVATGLKGYSDERNRPDIESTSRLSPYLRWGEVSPWAVWRSARAAVESGVANERDVEKFLSELAWRDFSQHLLFHDPEMTRRSWKRQFDDIAWRSPEAEIEAWRRGRTGVPIVDAGMRELWTTGWMHNRVRMIAASFLTKHLLVHWSVGENWFWDTLVDADEANNAASWQWVAGSGADAAPYFRIFNPSLQGERFDPDAVYVRRWVSELRDLPAKTIHDPATILLGDYPSPIVDLAHGRQRALAAFAKLKTDRASLEGSA